MEDHGGHAVVLGKHRPLWAVILAGVLTLGLSHFAIYFVINRELREFGRTYGDDPRGQALADTKPIISLLAVTFGLLLFLPPFISCDNTIRRLRDAEDLAELPAAHGRANGIAFWSLAFLSLPFTMVLLAVGFQIAYLQTRANKLWIYVERAAWSAPSEPSPHILSAMETTRTPAKEGRWSHKSTAAVVVGVLSVAALLGIGVATMRPDGGGTQETPAGDQDVDTEEKSAGQEAEPFVPTPPDEEAVAGVSEGPLSPAEPQPALPESSSEGTGDTSPRPIQPGEPFVIDCDSFDWDGVPGPDGYGYYDISARGMGCTAVKNYILADEDFSFAASQGFSCYELSSTYSTATYRCVASPGAAGPRAFRFTMGPVEPPAP